MAGGEIVIEVTSKNDTKAGFDQAKRDAADAGDAAGKSFADRFAAQMLGLGKTQNLIGKLFGSGLGGLFGGSGSGAGAGTAGIGGLLGSIGPVGFGAGVAAISATGILGIIPDLIAATGALASFGLLAIPTITAITGGLTGTATAAANLTTAQQNLSDAQAAANANPTAANLDAVKKAQTALTAATQAQTAAWAAMDPAQQGIVRGVQGIQTQFGNLASQLEPLVLRVAGVGLQIANKLLPALLPFAEAGGTAIDTLLTHFSNFVSSPQFIQFQAKMLALANQTLPALVTGLGKVGGAFGNLLSAMTNPASIKAIQYTFDLIALSINAIASALTYTTGLANLLFGALGSLYSQFVDNSTGQGPFGGLISTITGQILPSVVPGYTAPPGFGPGMHRTPLNAGAPIIIELHGSIGALFEPLKNEIRVRGGGGKQSVQIALGQTH